MGFFFIFFPLRWFFQGFASPGLRGWSFFMNVEEEAAPEVFDASRTSSLERAMAAGCDATPEEEQDEEPEEVVSRTGAPPLLSFVRGNAAVLVGNTFTDR